MRKEEFEALTGTEIPEKEYEVIEYVYQFHPVVSETSGKEEVAELWKSFGTSIFYDMLPRARAAEKIESEIRATRMHLEALLDQYNELKCGRMPLIREGSDE